MKTSGKLRMVIITYNNYIKSKNFVAFIIELYFKPDIKKTSECIMNDKRLNIVNTIMYITAKKLYLQDRQS